MTTPTWPAVLAMTLVVRDEQDVLAANLRHHLMQGVDVILVVDHGSRDRTPEILREFERDGRVHWLREEDPARDQVRRVNRLLRIAAERHAADWSSTATRTSSGCQALDHCATSSRRSRTATVT